MRQVAALLMVAVLTAGCFGWGHCDFTATDVSWRDPALYAALAPSGVTPPEGMAFDATGLDDAFAEAAVQQLSYRQGEGDRTHMNTVRLADGILAAEAAGDGPYDALRAAAATVLQTITDLAPGDLQATLDELEASRSMVGEVSYRENGTMVATPFYDFHVALDVPYDLRAAWGDGGAEPASMVQRGNWTYRFAYPTASTQLLEAPLVVDSLGQAHLDRRFPEGQYQDQVELRVRDALRQQGLPEPELMEIEGYIC